jgi:hypothetical protein
MDTKTLLARARDALADLNQSEEDGGTLLADIDTAINTLEPSPNRIKAEAVLNWGQTKHAYWAIKVGSNGPFRGGAELDIDQARAVRAELNRIESHSLKPSHQNAAQALQAMIDWNDDQQTSLIPDELLDQAHKALDTQKATPAQKHLARFPESNIKENCLFDMACPKCGQRNKLRITATIIAIVSDDGTDRDWSDCEWENNSPCECCSCSHSGTVQDFTIEGLDEELRAIADEKEESEVGK